MAATKVPTGTPDADTPYTIKEVDSRRVVVHFARFVDHERLPSQEEELLGLVSRYEKVACDLTETEALGSKWMRWLGRLHIRADRVGAVVGVIGMRTMLSESADALEIRGLRRFDSLDELWDVT